MASTDATNWPKKNAARRITFALRDVNDDLVSGATGLDSEVSKDGGAFADCTNEATEIGSTGIYYLDLTASEMNADTVAVQVKSSAKPYVSVMYPVDVNWDDLAVDGENGIRAVNDSGQSIDSISGYVTTTAGFAQAGSSTTITLAAGAPSEDLVGLSVLIGLGTGTGQRKRMITAYNPSTKVATITPAWTTTPDVTSYYLVIDLGDNWRMPGTSYTDSGTLGKILGNDIGSSLTTIGLFGVPCTSLPNNGITSAKIQDGAITAAKIASDAITAAKIASDAITAAKIAADAITDAKVASDVTIASVTGSVGSVAGNVGGNVAGSVGSVTAGVTLADGAITSAKIASGALTSAAFAADAISSSALSTAAADEIALRCWQYMQATGNYRQQIFCAGIQDVRSLTIAASGAGNNSYIVYSKTTGQALSYEVVNPGTNNASLTVSYSANKVTVSLATDGSAAATSTAAEIIHAINSKYSVQAIMGARRNGTAGIGGVAATVSSTALSGESASTGSDSNSGLTPSAKVATLKYAITLAASTPGTVIVLDPGTFYYDDNAQLPRFTAIRGAGENATFVRLSRHSNSANYIYPGMGTVIEDLTIDAQLTVFSGVFCGFTAGDLAEFTFRRVTIKSNSYALWLSNVSNVSNNPAIQPCHGLLEDCSLYGAVSALSSQGNANVRHSLHAKRCKIVADSWYYGDTIPGNSYAVLSVYTDIWLTDSHCFGKTTSRKAIAGGIQAGDPTGADRPGKIWMSGGSCYATNTTREKPKRITAIVDNGSNQAVFTVANHGYATDEYVEPEGLVGDGNFAEWNGVPYKCTVLDANTFYLRDPISNAALALGSDSYTAGTGTVKTGIEWAVFSDYDGSLIETEGTAYNHWSIKEIRGGVIHDRSRALLAKVSRLQSGTNFVNYVNPEKGHDFPLAYGWDPHDPWISLQDALLASQWGTTIYIEQNDSGAPIELAATLYVPPGVQLEGRGIDRTKLVFTFTGGTAASAGIVLANNAKVENLTIAEGADCDGITGILCTGSTATTAVVDHCKILTTFDCIRHEATAASTINIENSRLVSSSGSGLQLEGAAHQAFIGGIHPFTKGVAAVSVEDGAKATVAGYAEASGSYVFDASGAGSGIYAVECNFDTSKIRAQSGAEIKTISDQVLDKPNGLATGWTPRRGLSRMVDFLFGKTSGLNNGSGTAVIRDVGDTTNMITGVVDADGNRTSVTLGD